MKTELHPAIERGHADYQWLNTYHSFSFAEYFNPAREQFGCLRVLNDDTVAGGTGFDLHPHNNMEIVSIVLEGELEHRDSMGNTQVIKKGEVQVMSAGTGIFHAEYNHSDSADVKFFQIWIFPRTKGLTPRYDQKEFDEKLFENNLITLVTPDNNQSGDSLWIHHDAYISKARLTKSAELDYQLRIPGNGVFVFVIDGKVDIQNQILQRRDALAISETDQFVIKAELDSAILFIEIPMQ